MSNNYTHDLLNLYVLKMGNKSIHLIVNFIAKFVFLLKYIAV